MLTGVHHAAPWNPVYAYCRSPLGSVVSENRSLQSASCSSQLDKLIATYVIVRMPNNIFMYTSLLSNIELNMSKPY